jgi:transposase
LRAHPAEYGIVAAKGRSRLRDLLPVLGAEGILPELARPTLLLVAQLIEALTMQIRNIDTELLRWHRTKPASQRLETIPGVGFITATALAATVRDERRFRSGRQFAAWLGLVPRQNSTGVEGGVSSASARGIYVAGPHSPVRSTLGALRAGYRPALHPSIDAMQPATTDA